MHDAQAGSAAVGCGAKSAISDVFTSDLPIDKLEFRGTAEEQDCSYIDAETAAGGVFSIAPALFKLPDKIKKDSGATTLMSEFDGCSFNVNMVLKKNWKFEEINGKSIGNFNMHVQIKTLDSFKEIWGVDP